MKYLIIGSMFLHLLTKILPAIAARPASRVGELMS